MTARPLGKAEFARLMASVVRTGPGGPGARAQKPDHICAAVSGGGDSMALTLLAADWAAKHQIAFTALSVDHGLRRGSAAEARRVGAWLSARGIAHKVLTWRGAKPRANVQALARDARYRLLGDGCRRQGAADLLLAHHQDDQAETLVLRLLRGSGVDGLAAMSPLSERDGVRLLRPLLDVPKARLLATCDKFSQPWIDDPANMSDQFSRGRVRKLMAAFAAEGLTSARLAATAGRMGLARAALEAALNTLIDERATLYPEGYGDIDLGALSSAPREIGLRALSHMLRAVGGGRYAPRYDRLCDIFAALCRGEVTQGRTLAGCHLTSTAGVVRVVRENRHIEPIALKPGVAALWDGRFEVHVKKGRDVAAKDLSVAPLGRAGYAEIKRQASENKNNSDGKGALPALPARIRQTLPALWRGDELLGAPHLGFAKGAAGRAFQAEFRPLQA